MTIDAPRTGRRQCRPEAGTASRLRAASRRLDPLRARLAPVGEAVAAGHERLRPVLNSISPFAWLVFGAAIACWVLGWQFGWTELMLGAAACLVLLVLSTVFLIGRAQLAVSIALDPQRVVVGNPAAGQIAVRNVSDQRLLPIRLELPVGAAVATFDLPSLGGGAETDTLFVVPTNKRAVIPVGPATSVRGDPLGLLRRAVPWTGVVELFVHPKIVSLDNLGSGFLRDLEGQTTQDISMSDLAFHTLRDYVPGDDRRYVHWRSTARTGKLLVRQFTDTRRSHISVIIDAQRRAYLDEDDFELAISVGGSIAVRAIRDDQDTALLVGAHGALDATAQHALDTLSRAGLSGEDLNVLAAKAFRSVPQTSIAFMVTGPSVSYVDLRRAAGNFPLETRVIALQVRSDAKAGVRSSGGLTVAELSALKELPAILRAVTTG
jgi:uncharacterized protein (DUF58 family)